MLRRGKFSDSYRQKPNLFEIGADLRLLTVSLKRRKFIHAGQKSSLRPPAKRHPLCILYHQNGLFFHTSRLLFRLFRKLCGPPFSSRQAELLPRTAFTLRRAVWNAYRSAKLHERLVEIARAVRRHHIKQILLHRFFHLRVQNIPVIAPQP